jgi:RNA polymerase sigma factor (sigma-70 family)
MIATGKAAEPGFEAEYVDLFALAQRSAQRVVGDPHRAEDIAAETLARTLASWSRVRTYSRPFVVRVATNLALDQVRRRKPPLERMLDDRGPEDDVLARLVLDAALRQLSRRQRQVLVLRYVLGLGEADVAEVLRINAGTVKMHVHRGLESLRRRLGVDLEEVCDAAPVTA